MGEQLLRRVRIDQLDTRGDDPVDAGTLEAARQIVDDVRRRGEPALREHVERLGDLRPGDDLLLDRATLERARDRVEAADCELLERVAGRVDRFARLQRESVVEAELELPGGRALQELAAVERAGCYAPGGRFPLPSSVLMTAVTARAAGVGTVWVASPRPTPITLAAAAVAGADGLLAVGGAQAIAALAFGAGPLPPCDVVVGPGNRFVTAAKQLVAGRVGIDMLAGPSELTVLADDSADPGLLAADLLAQAEHDPDAVPAIVTPSERLVWAVEAELERQLADLPTAEIAAASLRANGLAVLVTDMEEGVRACDHLAPEHLEIHAADAGALAARCSHYGALFVGAGAAEVLGDYGAGPNHTLPTSGTARYAGGLSIFDFLRIRTRLQIDDPGAARQVVADAVRLAELEGLAGHAAAARRRGANGPGRTS